MPSGKRKLQKKRKGNCYVTAEALYHLLGGKDSGYVPHTVKHEGAVHWYLVHRKHWPKGGWVERTYGPIDTVVDPTASQFKTQPNYAKGRGRGFLTKFRIVRDQCEGPIEAGTCYDGKDGMAKLIKIGVPCRDCDELHPGFIRSEDEEGNAVLDDCRCYRGRLTFKLTEDDVVRLRRELEGL